MSREDVMRRYNKTSFRVKGAVPCPFCGETKDIRVEPCVYSKEGTTQKPYATDDEPTWWLGKCGNCFARTIEAEGWEDAFAFWQSGIFSDYDMEYRKGEYIDSADPFLSLRDDVVKGAFQDLKAQIEKILLRHHGKVPRNAYINVSDVFERYTSTKPEVFVTAAYHQAKYDLWRELHGCKYCRKAPNKCPHKAGYLWMKYRNGTAPPCPKEAAPEHEPG